MRLLLLPLVVACMLGGRPAAAGPPLDDALEWEAETADDAPASPRTLAPREGLETVLSGAGGDAPWLVPGGAPARLAAQLVSPLHTSGALRWRAGFAWRDGAQGDWSLDGSMLALDIGRSELYASVERRHWGPGWMGSLILDGAAPALAAAGWRRVEAVPSDSRWMRWLGPWTADVFVARLRGHAEPARPYLIGTRLQFEPLDGLSIGLSRTIQWGGTGRSEGARGLLAALLGRDNTGSNGIDVTNEPGNQLAGIDWRWTPDARALPSFYGQVVGEDEAGWMPSSNMVLLGVDKALPLRGAALRVFAEAANTIAGDITGQGKPGAAYRHHVYRQGYTQLGVPLGHPAGGDVRLASIGGLLQRGTLGAMAALSVGQAAATSQRFAAGPLRALNLGAHVDPTPQHRVGAGLWWLRDRAGNRGQAQVWWQHRP